MHFRSSTVATAGDRDRTRAADRTHSRHRSGISRQGCRWPAHHDRLDRGRRRPVVRGDRAVRGGRTHPVARLGGEESGIIVPRSHERGNRWRPDHDARQVCGAGTGGGVEVSISARALARHDTRGLRADVPQEGQEGSSRIDEAPRSNRARRALRSLDRRPGTRGAAGRA